MRRMMVLALFISVMIVTAGEVPGFDIFTDTLAFRNFKLSDIRLLKRASQYLEVLENGNMFVDREKLMEITAHLKETDILDIKDEELLEKRGDLLEYFGYAHCWGMSHVVKAFFEKARFAPGGGNINSQDVEKLADRVADGKTETFYSDNLRTLSNSKKDELRRVVAAWQKELLFSVSSLQYLTTEDPDKSFAKIRNSINSGKLTLIMVKFSITKMHVVLGYKVNGNNIYHYDCNRPGTACRLEFKGNGYHAHTYGSDVDVDIID